MFSVIVPTLNNAATLLACLNSVVNQTSSDFEVVVIDGCSTDETLEIANSFTPALGARLVIHSGPDVNVADANNRGVEMSAGAWLLFLGADDTLYEADTLARVAAFIDEHEPSDLVYGDVIARSTGSRYAGVFDLDRLLFEANICHQAIFYRRQLFAGIGPYNLRYGGCADWDFNIRCFSNPALVTRYMDIVVARWDNMTGMTGSEPMNKEFRKRLPKFFGASALEVLGRTRAFLRRKENRRAALGSFISQLQNRQPDSQNRISIVEHRRIDGEAIR